MQSQIQHKKQDEHSLWSHPLYSWLYKGLVCIGILFLSACSDTATIATPNYTVTTLNLQKNKANYLVLTNTSSKTVSGVTVRLKPSRDDSRSALALSVMAPTETPKLLRSGGIEKSRILHAELPEVPEPSLLPSNSRTALEGFSAKTLAAPLAPNFYTVGNTKNFNVLTSNSNIFGDKTFTLYKKVIDSPYTVHYWVAGNDYIAGNTATTDNIVGSTDMDNLANKFSNPSSADDILDASRTIFGEPWGTHSYSNLLPSTEKDLHILVHDIDGDGYGGGERIVGYFYPRDNATTLADSNQKLILHIDAPYISRSPDAAYSTAIHEFQHLIQYYQKTVRRTGEATETWLSEMMAQIAVDLISPKVGLGQESLYKAIANYLQEPWESLTVWNKTAQDYYSISDFGAFLLRRHAVAGSSEALARKFIQNDYSDYRAITVETGVSWENLLKAWGSATLSGYPASNDLAAIDPWGISSGSQTGIPMFHLLPVTSESHRYMLRFNTAGVPTGYFPTKENSIQALGPSSHVFVYLGKPTTTTARVEVTADPGIEYEIVPK